MGDTVDWFIAILIAGYPSGGCLPENFIMHLTPSAPDFVPTLVAVLLAVVFGLFVYIILIILNETEHLGSCPL